MMVLLMGSLGLTMSLQFPDPPSEREIVTSFLTPKTPIQSQSVPRRTRTEGINIGSLSVVPCDAQQVGYPGLYCINMTVPVTHSQPHGEKFTVAFIIKLSNQPQTPGQRKAFVYVEGGPGTIIHHLMDSYLKAYGRFDLLDTHDFIMMDQRGMGWSCGMGCIQSMIDMYINSVNTDTIDAYATAMDQYVTDCMNEIATDPFQWVFSDTCIIDSTQSPGEQRAKVAKHLQTHEAIRDLEHFFAQGGYSKVTLFGASYGTTFVQAYAGTFPSRIENLVLDGTLNTRLSPTQQADNYRISRQLVWSRLGTLCAQDPECRQDLCNSVSPANYQSCMAHVSTASTLFYESAKKIFDPQQDEKQVMLPYITLDEEFNPVPGMTIVPFRPLIEHTFTIIKSNPKSRAVMVRAVIAGMRGDYLPLVKIVYAFFGVLVDPGTNQINKYLFSQAKNGIGVLDIVGGGDYLYRTQRTPHPPLTPGQLTLQYLHSLGDHLDSFTGIPGQGYLTTGVGFSDPNQPVYSVVAQNTSYLPSPGWHRNYPIILLHSTTDAKVPSTYAPQLLARYSLSGPTHLLLVSDAGHCVYADNYYYGWTDPCVAETEEIVNEMISHQNFSATRNPLHTHICNYESVLPGYLSLPPLSPLTTPQDIAKYTLLEFLANPEYDAGTHFATICNYGGTVMWQAMNATATGAVFTGCSYFPGWTVDGMGMIYTSTEVEVREKGYVEMQVMVTDPNGITTGLIVIRDPTTGMIYVI